MYDRAQRFLDSVRDIGGRADRVAGVVLGAGLLATLLRLLLDFASRLHWSLGAILAATFVSGAVWLTYQVKRSSQHSAAHEVLAVLALGLMTLAVAGAWISYTLHVNGLGHYLVPERYSIGTFVDLYMYTFFDLLPGIKMWETLNVKPPIESGNVLGGLPLLGFKVFVAWLLFDVFRFWRRGRKKGGNQES